MRPAATVPLKSFQCRQCGGSIQLKTPQAWNVSCPFCGSITDARNPSFALVQRFEQKLTHKPLLPLGKRGKIRGEEYECIGFLRRTVTIEGTKYTWEEYLLWHPHRGYRWLAQFGGHWNLVKGCVGVPKITGNEAKYLNLTFRKFQAAEAVVSYVLGEFFWEVRRGEKTQVCDWISPPYVLSSERSGNEIVWSIGEYVRPEEIWSGFQLEGSPPPQTGVAPSQPSPYETSRRAMRWTFWIVLLALVAAQIALVACAKNEKVTNVGFRFQSTDSDMAQVSPIFEIPKTSNLELDFAAAGLSNNWAYAKIALLNAETHEAFDLGKEFSSYSGVDAGESWSEADLKKSAFLGSVPAGRYYLWVDPEFGRPLKHADAHVVAREQYKADLRRSRILLTEAEIERQALERYPRKEAGPGEPFLLNVEIRRDVPRWSPFFLSLPLILVPYWIYLWRRRSFEYRRWLESDYPMPGFLNLPTADSDDE